MDREKVKYDIERCICHVPDACRDCSHYKHGEYLDCMEELLKDALAMLKEDCHNCKLECLLQKYDELKEKYDALLKEQEKLVDVDALRKELGFSKMCDNCKQDTWACERDTFYSLKDFCERLDDAIDAILERQQD